MNNLIILISVIFGLLSTVNSTPFDYWKLRAQIIENEQKSTLGGQLEFNHGEKIANDFLMSKKRAEFLNAFKNSSNFLPAHNFVNVIKDIEKSEVYKIIQKMPKGAVLHAHDTALVLSDWILRNVTYRPNLYICLLTNGKLKLHFFDEPSTDCNWELLSNIRKIVRNIDERIYREMTMTMEDIDNYADVDEAWSKFNKIFSFIKPLLTYKPVWEDHYYQALTDLYNDNVMYIEFRTTLPNLYDLNGTVYSQLETVEVYKKITERFVSEHPDFIGAKLIYAPYRGINVTELDEYLKTLKTIKDNYPTFLAGFDLVGQEDKGTPLIVFANKLKDFDPSMNYFFHAGETDWYGTSTDENLIDAVLLGAKRIGHGYALTKHPLLMEMAKQRGIAVEVNPISNQVLGLVKDLRNHPAVELFANNYPIVISNDDPGLWGARALSYDFYQAFVAIMSQNSDLRALKQLALNSITYSSLNAVEKEKALKVWRQKWNNFVQTLTNQVV
ncbi:PREDICTED: adenosine deaminase CECR1-like [Polistes dominula]|uniref:adenosine deaminase n=1 Tax=Polistes dominula TaxID=743375 RepID=A0ABM1I7Q7_POLDO|nr:PREDICTED: adenosine deaminase CECR1-like [Polistes dominula]